MSQPSEGRSAETCERMLDALQMQMDQAAEIAGMLAHDVKNHLSSIGLNLDMLETSLREAGLENDLKRLDRIKTGIGLIRDAVQDFLKLSNPVEIDCAEINLKPFIAELVGFIEPECLADRIRIEWRTEPDLPPVRADRKNLKSALLNLIINAREAVGADGRITVACAPFGIGYVRVAIEDTGGGMDPHYEAKVFHRFFSTKEHGTGLGLMIVRRTITAMGGKVSFRNVPGTGMTWFVDLPRHCPDSEAASENREQKTENSEEDRLQAERSDTDAPASSSLSAER